MTQKVQGNMQEKTQMMWLLGGQRKREHHRNLSMLPFWWETQSINNWNFHSALEINCPPQRVFPFFYSRWALAAQQRTSSHSHPGSWRWPCAWILTDRILFHFLLRVKASDGYFSVFLTLPQPGRDMPMASMDPVDEDSSLMEEKTRWKEPKRWKEAIINGYAELSYTQVREKLISMYVSDCVLEPLYNCNLVFTLIHIIAFWN